MKRTLEVLSRFIVYMPNSSMGSILMLAAAGGLADGDDHTGLMWGSGLAGLALVAVSLWGMRCGRKGIAWLGATLLCILCGLVLITEMREAEPFGFSKGMLAGIGMAAGGILATALCMQVSKVLDWTASKLSERQAM